MQVVSVNIGRAERIGAKTGRTGIFKRPVPVASVSTLGVDEDVIGDLDHHGGPDQAVYAYTQEDYDWWSAKLGRDLAPGTFGENLTLDRWPADAICVGDRLHIGDVVLEVTSPRIPCVTLEARMGIDGFVTDFLRSGRPGPYFRVVSGGDLRAGQAVTVEPFEGQRKRLNDWPGLFGPKLNNRSEAEAWLAKPVHYKFRRDLEKKFP